MKNFVPQGIVLPLLTPFQPDGSIDEPRLRSLSRRMISAGVHGIFPGGSTGEFWALNEVERCQIIQIVIDEVKGEIPVYAGVGAIGTRQVINMARCAEEHGADALVVVTPFYINPSQDELYDHYSTVARNTALPILPYNNPGRTGISPLTSSITIWMI